MRTQARAEGTEDRRRRTLWSRASALIMDVRVQDHPPPVEHRAEGKFIMTRVVSMTDCESRNPAGRDCARRPIMKRTIALILVLMSLGAGLPHAAAIHGETHTPANTLLTNVASFQYTWLLRSTGQLFGDSRTVYTDTAYETVALLSAVDVATNLETADIQPADSYVFIKHIRNLGNGYDTYQVRGESTANFVRGMYLDADGDSVYDASDPPVSTVVLRELAETVVLVLVQAPAAAADGSADTLLLSATSTAVSLPSAETVTLALTVADTGLGIALVAPAS